MKVRDVAINSPQATRVLEKLKIDYCCGGDRQLGEACATAGIQLEKLEQMLEETDSVVKDDRPDFQRLSLAELITYILDKHHVFTKSEMARLEALTTKVVSAHGENHSELFEHKIRRLPVLDAEGELEGIVSMNDIVLKAKSKNGKKPEIDYGDVVKTYQAICEHPLPMVQEVTV
jgi:iron-sulfur cluster repair protein YtfE (RIC family)